MTQDAPRSPCRTHEKLLLKLASTYNRQVFNNQVPFNLLPIKFQYVHPSSILPHQCLTRHRLEALLLDLSLSRGDGRLRVRVDKAAALLAVLELSTLSGADTDGSGVDLGAAGGVAVGVGDAATSGELRVLAVANSVGARDVGGQGKGRGGDY